MGIIRTAAFAATLALASGSAGVALADTTVRIGFSANFNTGLPLYTSVVRPEVFEKHGIKIELVDVRASAANCIAAMLADTVDICSVGTTAGTAAAAEGAPLKVVAMLQGPVIEMHLSKAAVAKTGLSLDAQPADRIKGLKGLDVISAPPGAAYNVFLVEMLNSVGMSMSDIRFRALLDQVAMKEGLKNGTFEAVLWGAGAFTDLEESGEAVRWISIPRGDLPRYSSLPMVTMFGHQKWIEANPEGVAKLHAALADAVAALKNDDGSLSAAIKAKYYPDLPQLNWDDATKSGVAVLRPNLDVTEADWNFLIDLQKASAPDKDYAAVMWDAIVLPIAQAK